MELVSKGLLKPAFAFCLVTSSVSANWLHTIDFPEKLKTVVNFHIIKPKLNGKYSLNGQKAGDNIIVGSVVLMYTSQKKKLVNFMTKLNTLCKLLNVMHYVK